MDLNPYLEAVRTDLAAVASAAGPEARDLAERLVGPLESAMRLALLDALGAAAAEITRSLAPGSVDLRLRGREPQFVVALPHPGDDGAADENNPPVARVRVADGEDGALTRINLRLGQDLKDRIEEAARDEGVSVNAWLVRAASSSLDAGEQRREIRRAPSGGDRFTGWVG